MLIKIIDTLNSQLGKYCSWLLLLMVITTCVIVILRYVFNIGFIWMQETVRFFYAAVFLICAAYTFVDDEHVRVDIFYSKMNSRKKALVNIIGNLFFLLPFCFTILYYSFNYVINSWLQLEGSLEERGLHAVYIMKSFIWMFSIMLIMQGLSGIIKDVQTILRK